MLPVITVAEAAQCYSHLMGRGRDAADHPSVHGPSDNLGHKAGRAEAEKPRLPERYIKNQSCPLPPLRQELDYSQILGSAFFLANTRVCKQGCVWVMPCCCLHLRWGTVFVFKAVITQGWEAGRAPGCMNGRGWGRTAESWLQQSHQCPFFSRNPKGWHSYLHPTFQRPKVFQDITEACDLLEVLSSPDCRKGKWRPLFNSRH